MMGLLLAFGLGVAMGWLAAMSLARRRMDRDMEELNASLEELNRRGAELVEKSRPATSAHRGDE